MALYKTGPDRARFFFDALKYYHQRLSREFEMPTNQWITVQVAVSMEDGYEIRTYDSLGRERFQETAGAKLAEQRPDGKMELFSNFRGYARHFVLCQARIELPLVVVDSGEVADRDCIASYRFD